MLPDDEEVEIKRLMLLLFVVPVLGSFLMKLYLVWQYSDAGAAIFLFFLVILALTLIAFSVGKRSIFFGVGLLLLTVSFFLTATSFSTISEEQHLIEILQRDPNEYTNLVNSILYYNIPSISAGILLCVIGFLEQRRKLDIFGNLLLLIAGFFWAIWSIHYLQVIIENYIDAINVVFLKELEIIYILHIAPGILCLATSFFLAAISAPTLYIYWKIRKKARKTETAMA